MATAAKNGKKVVRKRRERKNIEKGQVHIRSSFNNTMVTVPLRRADRRRDRRQGGHGARPEDRGGVREGPRRRP